MKLTGGSNGELVHDRVGVILDDKWILTCGDMSMSVQALRVVVGVSNLSNVSTDNPILQVESVHTNQDKVHVRSFIIHPSML